MDGRQLIPVPLSNTNLLLLDVRRLILPYSRIKRKGDAGIVGVLGGCLEYTGAPYYAAMGALKTGADLAHVFCTHDAGQAIKSYSPELIVHPVIRSPTIDTDKAIAYICRWLERLTCLVIGPGLGREDPEMTKVARMVIQVAREMHIPIVIDADGLFLVAQDPSLVRGYKKAILTPNFVEFERLEKSLERIVTDDDGVTNDNRISLDIEGVWRDLAKRILGVCHAYGECTFLVKGAIDIIAQGNEAVAMNIAGSPKRSGGQGDVLAGSLAVFAGWALSTKDTEPSSNMGKDMITACWGASYLTRIAAAAAFKKRMRGMTAPDIIDALPSCFATLEGHIGS